METGRRERAISAGVVLLLHAGLLWLLLHARASTPASEPTTRLATFDVAVPPPSPFAPPARAPHHAGHSGRAGPTAERSAVTATVPIVTPPLPKPAPLLPQAGAAIIAGAAASGNGTGGGPSGVGSGSGDTGDGKGAGGGLRARLLSGTITPRDYPRVERSARISGTVTVEFVVGTDGRAHECSVAQSSGNDALDATTCRLVEARFRYLPAQNAAGAPVSERRGWRQRWWIEGEGR